MSTFPSLPLFTDAFIADTGHLNAQETGAYLMLMMMAWRSPGCRLADNDEKLARWARVDRRTWLRIKPVVMEFWALADGFWTQGRLSKEHDYVSKRAEVNRANGKHGGRPKSLENNEPANPAGSSRDSEKNPPNPNPNNTPVVPKGTDPKKEPEGFAEWWAAYPPREGANPRAAALDRYAKALKAGATPETLLAAVRAYAAELKRTGKANTEFVKQAQFFLSLRERRWEDYAKQDASQIARDGSGAASVLQAGDESLRSLVGRWQASGAWPLYKSCAPPDDPRTRVPAHILAEFNITPKQSRAA